MNSMITVMIPSYNPGKYLVDAIRSVQKQSYKNWEMILVDDCSTDDSLDLAGPLLRDPRIKVIKNEENLGQSKTQNIALKHVSTPFMVQLDSDDWFLPHTLKTLVQEFKKQPKDVALISGNIRIVQEEAEYLDAHDNKSMTYIKKGRQINGPYDFLISNTSLWPRCYRTSALKSIGGWPVDDPYEGRYMEDKIVLFRLIERYRFHWINEVLYVHRRHDYNGTKKLDYYNDVIEWNAKRVLKRWGDKYEPIFDIADTGWKYIVGIKLKSQ